MKEKESFSIKDVQKLLYNILKEVVNLCESNNINYYLVKGGLIGAVRHSGFIPWDPDVDIAVPYDNLAKFCSVLREKLKEPYTLYYFDKNESYEYLFPRVGIKGVDYRQLHLDVFIISNIPNDRKEQLEFFTKLSRVEKLNTIRNSKIFRPINSIKNRILLVVLKTLTICVPPRYIRKKYMQLISDQKQSGFIIQVGAVDEYGYKYIMPRSWFTPKAKMLFCDFNISIPNDFDSYLKQMYGDYHKVPEEAETSKQFVRRWYFPNPGLINEIINGKYDE